MLDVRTLIAACALAVAPIAAPASPGDVVVPAHRTKDGQWVPPNVPPTSGKTSLARRPSRVAQTTKRPAASTQEVPSAHAEPLLPPLLVNAQPIRR